MISCGFWTIGLVLAGAGSAGQVVVVDGRLDEAFWRREAYVWDVLDPAITANRVRFYLGWDDRWLYFAADVQDGNVVGTHTGRKEAVWLDDAVELFLDLGDGRAKERTPLTFEYGFSAAGGVSWTRGTGDGSGRSFPAHDWPPRWDSTIEYKTRLKPGTTLNRSRDRDAGYVVEARIAWSELGRPARQPGSSPATRPGTAARTDAVPTIGVNFLNIPRPEQRRPAERPLSLAAGVDFSNNHDPSRWKRIRLTMHPSLALRGISLTFPFWLGTTLYESQWKRHEPNERNFAWWWFDKEWWRRHFAWMERQHLNALCFNHPHPYPGLLAMERYPAARYYPPDVLRRHQEMFRWILAEGKRRGVRVYFLTWNICLPPSFAAKHGLKEFGSDTPLSRAYTRYCVRELFRTYPDFGGLVTMAGETPPGCVDFVLDAIIGGLKQTGVNPDLIYWTWCSWPPDTQRILAAYPRTRLLHYLQYEQFFKPMADPRIGRYSRECGGAPMIALGGPKSAHGFLFWGDPQYARRVILDLARNNNGVGMFIEAWCQQPTMVREIFARYAFHADVDYDPLEWQRWLAGRYGLELTTARSLLEAMQHASAIIPRFCVLVHGQTNRYRPQFGLPLIYYLEMPTLNTYVYENTQGINEAGYLTPRLGLSYPNPDWGERVLGVKEYVASDRPPADATTPPGLARELAEHARRCARSLEPVARVLGSNDRAHGDLARLLEMLRLNAALGEHFAAKIEAAVAWQRFKTRQADGRACLKHLDDSVEAWERVVEFAGRVFGQTRLPTWRSGLTSRPPWPQMLIWKTYRRASLHWRDHLAPFQRELELVRAQITRGPQDARLPLWEHLLAAGPDQVETIASFDFETPSRAGWQWSPYARRATDADTVLAGSGSVLFDTRRSSEPWNVVLCSLPQSVRLVPGQAYQIRFEYRILDPGGRYLEPFAVGARTPSGGAGTDIGDRRFWGGPAGARGERIVRLEPREYDDYYVFFCLRGRAALVVDNVRVERIKPTRKVAPASRPATGSP